MGKLRYIEAISWNLDDDELSKPGFIQGQLRTLNELADQLGAKTGFVESDKDLLALFILEVCKFLEATEFLVHRESFFRKIREVSLCSISDFKKELVSYPVSLVAGSDRSPQRTAEEAECLKKAGWNLLACSLNFIDDAYSQWDGAEAILEFASEDVKRAP